MIFYNFLSEREDVSLLLCGCCTCKGLSLMETTHNSLFDQLMHTANKTINYFDELARSNLIDWLYAISRNKDFFLLVNQATKL